MKPVGLIVSSFRPSDDATTLQFLVPSNFFAVSSLRKAAEILEKVNKKTALSKECKDLAQEVETALKKYGAKRIVVGVDIKDGFVSTSGWLVNTQIYYLDFLQELEKMGVQYIVCTDISKDGTLQGPSFPIYQKIKDTTSLHCIVSGGVKGAEDILEAARQGYYGCIVGKAYYEGQIDLKEVISCLPKESFPV